MIDLLIDLSRRCHLVPLLGNHEEMLLAALESGSELRSWLQFGGEETLNSYQYDGGSDMIPDGHVRFIRACRDFHETDDAHLRPRQLRPPAADGPDRRDEAPLGVHRPGRGSARTSRARRSSSATRPRSSGEILDLGFLVCIDTDCSRGGWLTALDVETGEVVQANQRGECRKTIRAQTVPDWIANARARRASCPSEKC